MGDRDELPDKAVTPYPLSLELGESHQNTKADKGRMIQRG